MLLDRSTTFKRKRSLRVQSHGHFKPRRKQRRIVAVNEMKAKLGKEQFFIWAARDIDTKEVLAFRVSFTRSSLDAELFLREVLKYCIGKP